MNSVLGNGWQAAAPGEERRRDRQQRLGAGRARFRDLLAKVGSGEHTSTGLSREEADEATTLMLNGQVDDAQLGAFLIAHRIRRPTPVELAGMLDSYRRLGPQLQTPGRRALCFNVPYDGRSRTAPLLPLTALVLAACNHPVVLHGGAPMPVKYGATLAELFAALDIHWQGLGLAGVQDRLERCNLGLVHQPDHFVAAERLVAVREQIGKRPPIASLELLWTPHAGERLLVSGFVHPPTEARAWETLTLAGEANVLTVKGLEGSTDLPTTRAGITARLRHGQAERLLLHPRDHGITAAEVPWQDLATWRHQALAALRGEGPLAEALAWNLAGLLWLSDQQETLEAALEQARALLRAQCGEQQRQKLARACPPPHRQTFAFEADFVADLRCIPMAVRRKLDLMGVKLKLSHWHQLAEEERQALLSWPDHGEALETLRTWLLERTADLPDGPAAELPRPPQTPWQQDQPWPDALATSCRELNLAVRRERWPLLGELERFALVKLAHPGHEHRNLPRALTELGLLETDRPPFP